MRVVHILPELASGGAERLVLAHVRADPSVAIATVFGAGALDSAFYGANLTLGERRLGRPSAAAFVRLVRAARAADIVHTHLFAGNLWGGLAARLAGRPQVAHEHNVDRDESAATIAVRTRVGSWPALTIAVSEAAARHSFAQDIVVVENGVDLARFSAPWSGGSGLLAIGRREPQKGFDVLLAALPPGVRLRVAGVGPYAMPHPQVEWLGLRSDVPELLRTADILVVPSRWEGFGLVALEAMAAGTPVIATAVDGLRELVGNAGLLVPPDDPVALRGAIARLLGDAGLRTELSQRGRARAQRYDLSRTFDGWQRAYGRVVATGG
ncbi:glycosyl transferase family 1 [Deltaproteobacteria bacterium]|nr:glycosyl transferase family 1 [Deltaproteobacteria bacterium]